MIPRKLIIFAKVPRIGSVKTRLARDLGQTATLIFYRKSLDATVRKATRLPGVQTILQVAPDNAITGRYFHGRHRLAPQGQGDLGQRMRQALNSDSTVHRVLIGGDIPDMRTADLMDAFDALNKNHAVFGPAEDGGFWLVGLRAGFQPRGLFQSMRWSHPRVLADAVATLPAHPGIAFVRTLNDIDNMMDYNRHRAG